jgi:hypothetical protein
MAKYRWDEKSEKFLVWSERSGKWVKERKKSPGKFDFNRPMHYVPDIGEFVAHATEKPVLISSRSKLAAYERSNGVRQCGDFKRGEIAERRKKKVEREVSEAVRQAGLRPEQVRPIAWTEFR